MEAVQVLSTAYKKVIQTFDSPATGSFYVSEKKAAELALQQQVSDLSKQTMLGA